VGSIREWRRPTFNAFPAATDYLKADPAKTAALRAAYKGDRKTLLVGIAWRSAANFNGEVVGEAAEKSIGLNQWGAILSIPGVTLINLQYGDVTAEISAARNAFKATIIEDRTVDNLTDLDTFAAQVAAMDLVISSSNSAAHIAGALGVPTWCMVPRALSKGRRWYWFGAGAYAPWYRAMTLFRQTRTDWQDVLADIALSLVTVAAKGDVLAAPSRYLEGLAQAYLAAGLGRILAKMDRLADAATAYRISLALTPTAETYNNLGTALRRMGHNGEAQASYAEAIKLKPDQPTILLNYATALVENNRLDEALAAYDRLLTLQPDNADAHYNRATTLLNAGKLPEGWSEFKWRLKRTNVHVRHEDFPHPVWSGQDLTGKHVLVWTDLGIGEEVLAASLVADAARAARRVTLLCSVRLVALFRRSFPDVTVDVRAAPLPPAALSKDIDLQMSLAELGAALRPSFEAFPARTKFLSADESLRDRLRAKYLADKPATTLIGISWRSTHPEIGRQKSLSLARWLPILKTPGITFVNLQYGDCQAELEALQRDHGITVINDPDINPLGDIDPAAAQIAAMDRVISVSNTAVHLAGGLGIPTWVMAPSGLGRLWYWFRSSSHCPWYPALTLRSPQSDNGWDALIADIVADLRQETRHG
jgi:tetratricopeptide (TPR) repeat protein